MDIIVLGILTILCLGLIVGVATAISHFRHNNSDEEKIVISNNNCSKCVGVDGMCEQDCFLEAATKEIEYFDDEELDRFAGRPADEYNSEEVEEFSNVLYTMQPNEVKQWNRSLVLRGINIPNQLKDELIAMIADE